MKLFTPGMSRASLGVLMPSPGITTQPNKRYRNGDLLKNHCQARCNLSKHHSDVLKKCCIFEYDDGCKDNSLMKLVIPKWSERIIKLMTAITNHTYVRLSLKQYLNSLNVSFNHVHISLLPVSCFACIIGVLALSASGLPFFRKARLTDFWI
jgi:hypothetical protein